MERYRTMGNYVAINCDSNITEITGIDVSKLPYHPHITIMYSSLSDIEPEYISQKLNDSSIWQFMVKDQIMTPSMVNMLPNADGGHSVCLIFNSVPIHVLHRLLSNLGMKHSYDELIIHLSITYNTPTDDAIAIIDNVSNQLHKIWVKPTDIVCNNSL